MASNRREEPSYDKEIEKIFHRDPRFDIRHLTEASSSSGAPNVDDGARFYSVATDPNLREAANVATMAGQQSPRMDDARFFRRAISTQEPGAHAAQTHAKEYDNLGFLALDEAGPRGRLSPSSSPKSERSSASDAAARRRRSRVASPSLPTIPDDEMAKRGSDEKFVHSESTLQPISETASPSLQAKPTFRIAPPSDDDDDILSSGDETRHGGRPGASSRDRDRRRDSSGDEFSMSGPNSGAFGAPGTSGPGQSRRVSFGTGSAMGGASQADDDSRDERSDDEAPRRSKAGKHRRDQPRRGRTSRRGSELLSDVDPSLVFADNASGSVSLVNRDLDALAAHRTSEHAAGRTKRASVFQVHGAPTTDDEIARMNRVMEHMYGQAGLKELDHSPHDLFVELDELQGEEWVEQARWIKYEENREEGAERWGRAHISSLSFHSLINLRVCLESSVFMLDYEANSLLDVFHHVTEEFCANEIIEEDQKGEILRTLFYKHRHVDEDLHFHFPGLRKNVSQRTLNNLVTDSASGLRRRTSMFSGFSGKDHSQLVLDMPDETDLPRSASQVELYRAAQSKKESILRCLAQGTEGVVVMVASMKSLTRLAVAFVRLAEGIFTTNALEVPLPVRFVFVLLTPRPYPNLDCLSVGRAFGALMANPSFQHVVYRVDDRKQLLSAFNEFLGESVVLPPGDWESRNLLSLAEVQEMRRRRQERILHQNREEMGMTEDDEQRRKEKEKEKELEAAASAGGGGKRDPLVRTTPFIPFGGAWLDIKERYPWYWSDIRDAFNTQCLGAVIFIFFACLSGAIAFGGLLGHKTEGAMGVSETLISTAVAGVIYSLLAGSPMIIIGVTGPVLLFDVALYGFAKSSEVEFLPWRVWIALWNLLIALVVAFFQGSTLVRYFTRFTKDIFATLIAVIYIYEAFYDLFKIYRLHPPGSLPFHCNASMHEGSSMFNGSSFTEPALPEDGHGNATAAPHKMEEEEEENLPNVALLSTILMFSTFFIAYFLKIFRNGKYLGRTIRRSLGDFGVPIGIIVMVGFDLLLGDSYTEKLKVPEGLQVTDPSQRGWVISPMGIHSNIAVWVPFVSFIPALLLFMLLFMELHICELLMLDRTTKKGGGVHFDIVLLCAINLIVAFIGGPWICAATVRAISHVAALTVMSTTHAPGESPKIVDVIDQRLTHLLVAVLVGMAVLLSPLLKAIPNAVLFGVFLYMGFSNIGSIQMFDRIALLFKPVKYHPPVSYVRRVRTWRMHLFTFLEFMGLVLLWVVKSTPASLAFPFFVVAMVPYRMCLKFIFSEEELSALDGPNAGQVWRDDDEPDFYAQANA